MPATVLSTDSKDAWLSLGLPLVLEQDLSTSRRYTAAITRDESSARQNGAALVVDVVADFGPGRRQLRATLRDLTTQQNVNVFCRFIGASDISAMDAIAKCFDDAAASFPTRNDGALQTYTEAVLASDPNQKIAQFTAAARQDPAFGLAYLAGLQILEQQQRPTTDAYAEAETHKSSFTALDRAQFNVATKRASGASVTEQLSAAKVLIGLTPNSLQALQQLADLQFAAHDANSAVRTLAQIKPEPQQVLANQALCALVLGDHVSADQLARRSFKLLEDSQDPFAPLAHGAWLSVSQDLAKAILYLQGIPVTANADLRAMALAQIAIWQASDNHFGQARVSSGEATKLAQSPVAKLLAINSVLISTSDEDPRQWSNQVLRSALSDDSKQLLLGYGFFMGGHYDDAAKVWSSLATAKHGSDPKVQVMLAAARREQNSALRWSFPNLTGGDQFAFLTYRYMLAVTTNKRQ